jgi:hypothetical protein
MGVSFSIFSFVYPICFSPVGLHLYSNLVMRVSFTINTSKWCVHLPLQIPKISRTFSMFSASLLSCTRCMLIRLIPQVTSKSSLSYHGSSSFTPLYFTSRLSSAWECWYCRRHAYFQLLQMCVEFFHRCIRTFVADVVSL